MVHLRKIFLRAIVVSSDALLYNFLLRFIRYLSNKMSDNNKIEFSIIKQENYYKCCFRLRLMEWYKYKNEVIIDLYLNHKPR